MLAVISPAHLFFPASSSTTPMHSPTPPPSHKRPRGLWKRRRDSPPNPAGRPHDPRDGPSRPVSRCASLPDEYDDDSLDDDRRSTSSASSKRRRCSGHFDFSDLDHHHTPSPLASPLFTSRTLTPLSDYHPPYPHRDYASFRLPSHLLNPVSRRMQSPSRKGKQPSTADYEDWENLKELFARAVDRYDADDITEALPLLRAVIRECHRFLTVHPDPSVVYSEPYPTRPSRAPHAMTPTDERLARDWVSIDIDLAHDHLHRSQNVREPTTAFHAVFGTTLFFVGSIIAQDPALALPGEPSEPSAYWLAALDVFETGENLPSRTAGLPSSSSSSGFSDLTEDWRMAIIWGRTLVCLAEEKVAHSIRLAKEQVASEDEYCYFPNSSPFSMTEPAWPADSPFAAIAAARPPVSRRMSLYSASAHDVMVLAMDQFSRGIFHMPHPHYAHAHNPPSSLHFSTPHTPISPVSQSVRGFSPSSSSSSSGSVLFAPTPAVTVVAPPLDPLAAFSRPKELFTIASEVLGVAERLPSGTERAYWAGWADSVFTQMKMEADVDAWRGPLMAARGRCWLVMGSAGVDDIERALEGEVKEGAGDVLESREAGEAREGLAVAISFFERAKGALRRRSGGGRARGLRGEEDGEDVGPLLAEALVTLANLTTDENTREELYARAQAEVGEQFSLGLEVGEGAGEDAMDES